MTHEQREGGYSSPHWKGDGSYTVDQGFSGLIKVPVKALDITWGNDTRFWQQIDLTDHDTQEIGFKEGMLLLQVNWIEVKGNLNITPTEDTKYEIYYMVKFRVDAFGWHSAPIKFKVRHKGEETHSNITILESYREKHDVWHEIPGGEFSVASKDPVNVEFGIFEVDSDWWKGGMVLGGVKIKAKSG